MRKRNCLSIKNAAKRMEISESQVRSLLKNPTSPLKMFRYSTTGDIKVTIDSIDECMTPQKLKYA